MNPESTARRVRFSEFEFDRLTAELRRDGVIVPLPPQPTKLLALLIDRAGELVTRDELRRHLWPNTVVEFDHGLNTCIRQIRDALGERADAPTYVQTVPRRGYRFAVPLRDGDAIVPHAPVTAESAAADAPTDGRTWVRVAAMVGIVLLIGVGVTLMRAASSHSARRVAVLPFQNLSPGALTPEFVDGLSEELTVALSKYRPADIAVISRTSAQRIAESGASVSEIADALRATHVVQGTVRAQGDTVIATASLVRTDDDQTVWSERFTAEDLDPMAQMGPVGARIASAMVGSLEESGKAVAGRSTLIPQARDALLKGRYLLARSQPAKAEAELEEAVRIDPEYGLAFALLARARLARGALRPAAEAAAHARDLAPDLPETHLAMGDVAMQVAWDWELARDEYRAALAVAPGDAELHQRYAFVLALLGRPEESLSEGRLALDLDPISPLVDGDLAWLYLYARRYPEAADRARSTLSLDDENAAAWYCLLLALERDGRAAEAHPIAVRVAQRYGAAPEVVAALRRVSPAQALDRFWRWDLEQMRLNRLGSRFPLDFAAAFARFEEPDSAFSYIDRGIRDHVPFAGLLALDPRFDPLRADHRFSQALAALGLPARRQSPG